MLVNLYTFSRSLYKEEDGSLLGWNFGDRYKDPSFPCSISGNLNFLTEVFGRLKDFFGKVQAVLEEMLQYLLFPPAIL